MPKTAKCWAEGVLKSKSTNLMDTEEKYDPALSRRLQTDLMILQSDFKKKQAKKAEIEMQKKRLNLQLQRLEIELAAQDAELKKLDREFFIFETEIARTKKLVTAANARKRH